MAKGQLHSTGTICKAEHRCPLEGSDGSHFDSVDDLIDHTAKATNVDSAELRSVIASKVSLAEAVAMAREGILGGAVPKTSSKPPKVPGKVKIDLSSFESAEIEQKFLENLGESFPVSSFERDSVGRYSIEVEAEANPSEYEISMATSSAVRKAASDVGYSEEDYERTRRSFNLETSVDVSSLVEGIVPHLKVGDKTFDPYFKRYLVTHNVEPEIFIHDGKPTFYASGGFEGVRGGKQDGTWRAMIPVENLPEQKEL